MRSPTSLTVLGLRHAGDGADPQYVLKLNGKKLLEERRTLQAKAIVSLCLTQFDRDAGVIGPTRLHEFVINHYQRRRPTAI